MMGLLGRIFGEPKAVEEVVGSVSRGLDSLIYTDQERDAAAAQERAAARAVLIEWFKNTQGQNLARRVLAFAIAGTWLLQYFASMTLSVVAVWLNSTETVGQVRASAALIGQYADGMTGAMMLILGFYFAAPHIGSIVGPALDRFGGKK